MKRFNSIKEVITMKELLITTILLLSLMTFSATASAVTYSFVNKTYSSICGSNCKLVDLVSVGSSIYAIGNDDLGNVIIKTDRYGNLDWRINNYLNISCGGSSRIANLSSIVYEPLSNGIIISGYGKDNKGYGIWKFLISEMGGLNPQWNRTVFACWNLPPQLLSAHDKIFPITVDDEGTIYGLYMLESCRNYISKFRNSDGYILDNEDLGACASTQYYTGLTFNPTSNLTGAWLEISYANEILHTKIMNKNLTQNWDGQTTIVGDPTFYYTGDMVAGSNGDTYFQTDIHYPVVSYTVRLNSTGLFENTSSMGVSGGNFHGTGVYYDNEENKIYVSGRFTWNETFETPSLTRLNQNLTSSYWDIYELDTIANSVTTGLIYNPISGYLYSAGYTNVNGLIQPALFYWTGVKSGSITNMTNINLTALPKYADYSDLYTFYVNVTGGYTPFNVSWYVDGFNVIFNDIQYTNYFTSGGGGYGIGNHTAYAIIKDDVGTVKISNVDWFYTNYTGMINHPTLTVVPSTGNVFTTFNFSTSPIFNGTPPYTVQIKALEVGGHIVATCYNILENGVCNGTFSGTDLFNSGNIPITGVITDAENNVGQTTTTSISFTKQAEGNPLLIDFGVIPMTNGTTDDLYSISLNFTGSKPPFQVEFRDTNGLICSYYNTYTTKFKLNLYFYSGDHYLNAIVYGSDGQMNMSNFGYTDKLFFEIDQAGSEFMLKNRVINCLGTLGEPNNNEVYTGEGAGEYGGTEEIPTPTSDKDLCYLGNCIRTSMVALMVLVGVSIYGEMKAKSGGTAFMGIMVVGIIALAYLKIIPMWIAIIGGVLIALVFAYLGRKMIKGG